MKSAFQCHRLGCLEEGTKGVRGRDNRILLFCIPCWRELLRTNVISAQTGQVLTD